MTVPESVAEAWRDSEMVDKGSRQCIGVAPSRVGNAARRFAPVSAPGNPLAQSAQFEENAVS